MTKHDYWLKPIFILLGIFGFLILMIEGMPSAFPTVSWSTMNPTIIEIMPWLIALGLTIAVLVYIWGRR